MPTPPYIDVRNPHILGETISVPASIATSALAAHFKELAISFGEEQILYHQRWIMEIVHALQKAGMEIEAVDITVAEAA